MTTMRLRLKLAVFLVLTAALITVTVYCWPVIAAHARAPEKTMQLFYMGDHEPELADPLILAGGRVGPTVTQAISNAKMPLRRYAISFLGDDRVREAIPTLERIVSTETEADYFRGDALEAIYKIDPSVGRRIASGFDKRSVGDVLPTPATDYLGWSASEVLSDSKRLVERRTVWRILHEYWFREKFE
jgi:hypothetical protein